MTMKAIIPAPHFMKELITNSGAMDRDEYRRNIFDAVSWIQDNINLYIEPFPVKLQDDEKTYWRVVVFDTSDYKSDMGKLRCFYFNNDEGVDNTFVDMFDAMYYAIIDLYQLNQFTI